MIKRHLAGGFALVSAATMSGCGILEPESPERCVERFEQLVVSRPDLRDRQFQPIFTYDVTHMEGVLEHLVGEGNELEGLRMTLAHGASGAALDAFYKAEVPPKGAIFAADDFSLFRARGTPGSRHATLVEGCRETPPKARLVHVQLIALGPRTEDRAPT